MKKKISKIIKLLFLTIVLCLAYSFSVKTYDNSSGEDYVKYWKDNQNFYESTNQDENFTFNNLNDYVQKNDLILYGEFHGINETIRIDTQLIKYLNKKVGMRIHLAEIDFSQSYFLNEYLTTGNETLINYFLNSWIINHGHNNLAYKNKWIEIYKLNKTNPKSLQIKVYGIDKIQNIAVTQNHLKILLSELNLSNDFPKDEKLFLKWAQNELPLIISKINLNSANLNCIKDIEHIKKNLIDYKSNNRENIMFLNFIDFYKRFNFANQKIYGYFGEAHVLQKEMNNKKDFGALLNNPNSPVKNKTYTIVSRYLDSYMSAPSKFLPFFLRSEKEHTKTEVSCDNTYLLYYFGINDLKKITTENSNTFFDINKSNSPYKNSVRLINSIGLLSIISGMNLTDKNASTTDYAQGIILIRNSDWAQPAE